MELLATNIVVSMSLELGIGKVAEYHVVFLMLAHTLH